MFRHGRFKELDEETDKIFTEAEVQDYFDKFDADGDHHLDFHELEAAREEIWYSTHPVANHDEL